MFLITIINCVSLDNDTGKEILSDEHHDQEDINTEQETQTEEQTDSDIEDEESTNSEIPNDSGNSNNREESSSDNNQTMGSLYDAITTSYSVPGVGSSGTTNISSVPMPSGIISDVKVYLSIEHTCTKDLSAIITSPNGTTVELFDLSRMVVCSSNIMGADFDDESTLLLDQGSSPFSDSYKPIEPLSNFDGENAAGVWNLTIIDSTVGDSGKLTEWAFEFIF